MKWRALLVLAIISIFISLVMCHRSSRYRKVDLEQFVTVTPEQARTIALQHVKGQLLHSALRIEDGFIVYAFTIQLPDHQSVEIAINGKSGTIVKESEVKEPIRERTPLANREKAGAVNKLLGTIPVTKDTNLIMLAQISEEDAKKAATELVNGTAEDVRLENEDGFLIYNVRVHFRGDQYRVLVDAGNGKVLDIENE